MEMKPRSDRVWLWLAVAFAGFWLLYLIFISPRRRDGGTFQKGQPADFSWPLKDLKGEPLSLAKYRGKTIFLNEWATWCGPCVAELPSISQLAENPKLKDVVFLCVSIDDSLDSVRQFVGERQTPLGMTIVWSNGRVPDVYVTDGIPTTFVIAPDGRIMEREVGSRNWNEPAVINMLESLAQKPAGTL